VYSASDFEKFSRKILSSADRRAAGIVARASEEAEAALSEAEEEARRRYEEGLRAIGKEAAAFEKEARAKIETSARVAWQRELARRKASVLESLEKRIDGAFETLARCFLEWLLSRYGEGRIELYEGLRPDVPEGFEVVAVPEKAVRLTKENLIVEFTPASVMEEFAPLVDGILAKTLGAEA
jgi:vacuolar-type H+-ATPase subunit H